MFLEEDIYLSVLIEILDLIENEEISNDLLLNHLLALLNENFEASFFLVENREEITYDLLRAK